MKPEQPAMNPTEICLWRGDWWAMQDICYSDQGLNKGSSSGECRQIYFFSFHSEVRKVDNCTVDGDCRTPIPSSLARTDLLHMHYLTPVMSMATYSVEPDNKRLIVSSHKFRVGKNWLQWLIFTKRHKSRLSLQIDLLVVEYIHNSLLSYLWAISYIPKNNGQQGQKVLDVENNICVKHIRIIGARSYNLFRLLQSTGVLR